VGEKVLTDHQIKVVVTNHEGVITLLFPDGQNLTWPVSDRDLRADKVYLTLSCDSPLPTKEELARQILKEIFNGSQ